MESNYRNREFEQYVKENADQYRMFPSEKVWKNIHSTLHTRRRWYGAGLAFLLLLTGTAVTWVMISYPVTKNQKMTSIPVTEATTSVNKPVSPGISSPVVSEKVLLPFSNPVQPASTPEIRVTPASGSFDPFSITLQNMPSRLFSAPAPDAGIRNERAQVTLAITSPKTGAGKPVATIPSTTFRSPDPEERKNNEAAITAGNPAAETTKAAASRKEQFSYPLTVEHVANGKSSKKPVRRLSWQLYITPTISYRILDENKSSDDQNGTSSPFGSLTDVNKAVIHKPDMGLQVGLSARYPVTKNLKIRAGLQFNINRYDIKAFDYNPEVATINLSDADGMSSVSAWTPYRNFNGYESNWLKNYYFSVSAPIGVEVMLFGNRKTSVGVAGTIQPTYIIRDRAYLLSTDYKNYAQVPWLTRHVNLNTGFETFVNYTTGKTKWQVGPQVRYQILSSFNNKYPVKENLFDFGVKIGLTLND